MRVRRLTFLLLVLTAGGEGLVAPGSGAPGGVVGYLWIILAGTAAITLFKKNYREQLERERVSSMAPPVMSLFPPPTYNATKPSEDPVIQRRRQRALKAGLEEEMDEVQRLLGSVVARLDTDGCVLKLMCHLEYKRQHSRTLEENVLLQLLSSSPEIMSSYNASFLEVTKLGQVQGQPTCSEVFPKCFLREQDLYSLLGQAWTCSSLTLHLV